MAPGLQKQAEELKRSQLEDKLEGKLDTRPRPSKLVEQHILHGMCKTKNQCPSCDIVKHSAKVDLNMRLFLLLV